MTDKTHAVLSPSGAHRWVPCPGSVVMVEQFGRRESDPKYRDEGTACHEVASFILRAFSGATAAAYVGRRIEVGEGRTVEFTDAMAELTQTYVDNVRAYITNTPGVEEVMVEVEVPIAHLTGEDGAMGTADCVVISPREWQVHDAKFGRTPVDVVGNEQLLMYGLGVLEKLSALYDAPEEFLLVIHQPKLGSKPFEWRITTADLFSRAAVFRNAATRVEAARACRKANGPFEEHYLFPGEKQCGWCDALPHCPRAAKRVEADLMASFDVIEAAVPEALIANATHPDNVIDDLAKKYRAIGFIEQWCKQVAAAFESRLLAGETHPDFKVVQGRKGARKWADEKQAEEALKTYRLKVEEMYDLKLISPPSAEKLHKAGVIGPRQWPKLQALITQSEGQPSVAPASDPRPAVTVTPTADAFDELGPSAQAEDPLA